MAVLVGIAAAVALLYLWLIGHWFARVLTFIALALVLAGAGAYTGSRLAQLTAVDTLVGDGRHHGPKVEHHCPPNVPVALCDPAQHEETPDEFLARTTGVPLHIAAVVPEVYAAAFPIVGMLIGAVAAWFISGIPAYYWLHRMNAEIGRQAVLTRRGMELLHPGMSKYRAKPEPAPVPDAAFRGKRGLDASP